MGGSSAGPIRAVRGWRLVTDTITSESKILDDPGLRRSRLPLCCAAMSDDPQTRATITLQPGRQKRAEGGHPWIYSNEIAMDAAAKALPAGGLVTIRKADGKGLGVATFNPHPLVSARLLSRDATQKIDRTFLTRAMRR